MQDLRLVLIILGFIAIGALIAHGLWSNKKNQVKPLKNKPLKKVPSQRKDELGFDSDGIGSKRVITNPALAATDDAIAADDAIAVDKDVAMARRRAAIPAATVVKHEKIEPKFNPLGDVEGDIDAVSFDGFTATDEQPPRTEPADISQPSRAESVAPAQPEVAAVITEVSDRDISTASSPVAATVAPLDSTPEEAVFVINIMARENSIIEGALLLQDLSTLGFKFGAMNIFHRHVDAAGKGPVIFSLANMLKPGTFDIDNMAQFQSPGVSLFMMFPCAGDASKNYKLMLNAAERIADGVDALLLDAARNPLTDADIEHEKAYIEQLQLRALARQAI